MRSAAKNTRSNQDYNDLGYRSHASGRFRVLHHARGNLRCLHNRSNNAHGLHGCTRSIAHYRVELLIRRRLYAG
ncbi:hypothetical protein ABID60_008822 [Bradyrhizobium sp. S3.5.5]